MGPILRYFDECKQGSTTVPSGEALLPLSGKLDHATKLVLKEIMDVLRSSKEHEKRVALLKEQPRTAGPFKNAKIILQNASDFERMVALSDWLAQAHINKPHTFFFCGADDGYLPVQAKKPKNIEATLMHCVLGATRGALKAPKYVDWAKHDPQKNNIQKVFLYSLEGLEIVRQPQYSAATLLKGNAYELGVINAAWRYGSTYACVEDKGQSKNSPKKLKSAGLNICTLVDELGIDSDPLAEEVNICLPIQYEDYSDENYADDLELSVQPGAIIKAAKAAIVDKDEAQLCRLMENLAIAKIGVPKTPMLCDYIVKRLIANSTEK